MRTAAVLLTVVFYAVTSIALGDTFGDGAFVFNIDFVTVGNPGNVADTTGNPNPVGSVPYSYRIGKFEISEQMIVKANVLAGLGITIDSRGANKPATSITWFEAAKFINWLNTSSGSPPAYKFNSSGTFGLWEPGDAGYNSGNLFRNNLAKYFLPSVDEWYKAAYYDGANSLYYDFPTGSNSAPTAVASGTGLGTAVYLQGLTANDPADVSLAGGLSPYGVMAMAGNVYEREETEVDLVNDFYLSPRGVRGGSMRSSNSVILQSISRSQGAPDAQLSNSDVGFRVASAIPEPSTILLAFVACAGLPTRHRKPTSHNRV